MGASLTVARRARADDESVIVVDVTEAASGLDSDKLRAQIAGELGARAIKPDDPRARAAKGTVTVDVDRQSGELSVTYLARVTATTRRVPLPADAAAARSDAVTLAGNLARDEASGLAAALRKQSPAPEPRSPATPPARPSEETREGRAGAAARLQATLDDHARREGSARTFAWTAFFAGSLGGVGISRLDPGFDRPLGAIASSMASVVPLGISVGVGALPLFAGSSFDKLAADHRKSADIAATEDKWRQAAQLERKLRSISGILELSFSAVAIGAGTIAIAEPGLFTSQRRSDEFAGVMFGVAAGEAILGIYFLTTEGSVESALRAYEQTTGHVARPKEAWLRHVEVGYAPGGATATFAAAF
ncbi:MAG TPA: hypothetical protein VLT33_23260 [Labilithrix sp.]|nr:hypothetical protein [Labilithrix sp.]